MSLFNYLLYISCFTDKWVVLMQLWTVKFEVWTVKIQTFKITLPEEIASKTMVPLSLVNM